MEPQNIPDSAASVNEALIADNHTNSDQTPNLQRVSQTMLKLIGQPELRQVLTIPETAPDVLERLHQLVMMVGQLRAMLASQQPDVNPNGLPDLDPNPDNLAPYVEDEAYEVLAALERHADRAEKILPGARNHVLQRYVAIDSLIPRLLWYIARSHYDVMQLLGGIETRILACDGEWRSGILRLAAILDAEIANDHWQLDLATLQPPQLALDDSILIEEPHIPHQEPLSVETWLARIRDRLQTETPEIRLFLEQISVEVLEPGRDWQPGFIKLQLALVFTDPEPTAAPNLAPEPTLESGSEPVPEPTVEPVAELILESAPELLPEPAPEPPPELTAELPPEPTAELSAEPTLESQLEPTSDAALESTPELTPEAEPQPAVTSEPEPELTTESQPESTAEATTDCATSSPEPASEPASEAASEPALEPTVQSASEPTVEADLESTQEHTEDPVQEKSAQIDESLLASTSASYLDPIAYDSGETLMEFVSDLESLSIEALSDVTSQPDAIAEEPPSSPQPDDVTNAALADEPIATTMPPAITLDISAPDVITLDMFRAELPIPADPSLTIATDIPTELTLEAFEDELTDVADILMPGLFLETTLPPISESTLYTTVTDEPPTLAIFEQELSDAVESVLKGSPDAAMSLAEFAELVVEAHTPQPKTDDAQPETIADPGTKITDEHEFIKLLAADVQSRPIVPDIRIVIDPHRTTHTQDYAPDHADEETLEAIQLSNAFANLPVIPNSIAPESDGHQVEAVQPDVQPEVQPDEMQAEVSVESETIQAEEYQLEAAQTETPQPEEQPPEAIPAETQAEVIVEQGAGQDDQEQGDQEQDEVVLDSEAMPNDAAQSGIDPAVDDGATIAPMDIVMPIAEPIAVQPQPIAAPTLPKLVIEMVSTIAPDDRRNAILQQKLLTRLPALQTVYPAAKSRASEFGRSVQQQNLATVVALAWQLLDQIDQEATPDTFPHHQITLPLDEWMSRLLWHITSNSYDITQLVGGIPANALEPDVGWIAGRLRLLATLTITTAEQDWSLDLSTGSQQTVTGLLAPGVLVQSEVSDVLQEPQRVEQLIGAMTEQLHVKSPFLRLLATGANINVFTPGVTIGSSDGSDRGVNHDEIENDAAIAAPTTGAGWQLGTMRLDLALELVREGC